MFILINLYMSHTENYCADFLGMRSFLFGKIRLVALLRSAIAIVTNLLKRIAILHKHP